MKLLIFKPSANTSSQTLVTKLDKHGIEWYGIVDGLQQDDK